MSEEPRKMLRKKSHYVNTMSPPVVKKKIRFDKIDEESRIFMLPELSDMDESTVMTQKSANKEVTNEHSENKLSFVHTMTNEQLNEHIKKCLEMSSENKITPKNAFAFQLIDCMKLLVQKENFSTMACTLDAGAKIYSYRVDALHQQVVKLAEEMIHHQRKKKNEKDIGDETELNEKLVKGKTRAKKKNVIVSSDNLTRKLKGEDPKDRFRKVDPLPGAIISTVRRDVTDLSFTLENNLQFWQKWDNYKPLKANGILSIPECEIIRHNEIGLDNNQDNSEISQTQPEISLEMTREGNIVIEEIKDEASPSDSIFDMSIDRDDDSIGNRIDDQVEDDIECTKEVEVVSTALKRLHEEAEVNGAVCKSPSLFEAMKIVFSEFSDYHYLNMKNSCYWAGPEFWKRPKGRPRICNLKKNPRKKKEAKEITYDFDPLEINEKWNKNTNRRLNKLQRKTVTNWQTRKTTSPIDLNIDMQIFFDLFHISRFTDSIDNFMEPTEFVDLTHNKGNGGSSECGDVEHDYSANDDIHVDFSSSQDLNGTFYHGFSQNSSCSEDKDPLNSAFYDVGLMQPRRYQNQYEELSGKTIKVQINTHNTGVLDETLLVPAPKVVHFEPIKYSTKPIRVDMLHLKQSMMGIINEEIEQDSSDKKMASAKQSETDATVTPETKFSSILKTLPSKLDKRSAEDLSPAMAFLALLTLANENNLQLENDDTYEDVVIRLENDNSTNTEIFDD